RVHPAGVLRLHPTVRLTFVTGTRADYDTMASGAAQPSERSTAWRQRARRDAAPDMSPGSKSRSDRQISASSSVPLHTPAESPARYAAPMAVVSCTADRR